jgi:carboxymethylenebutenolidase
MPSFQSGGKSIRIDHYFPSKPGSHPAVLLVHGSGGPLGGIDPFANQAAQFGVHVFVVHYFERTGHNWVAPGEIEPNFIVWWETLSDAVSFISVQPNVDSPRIALLGFSLGAYLSLALAAYDKRVVAVAELFGGFPKEIEANAATLPPVLILHGEADKVVPVSEAYRLEAICKRHNIPYEIKIYRGQGHGFTGLAQMDAMRRIVGFLRKNLQKAA